VLERFGRTFGYSLQLFALFALYVVTAKLGLRFDAIAGVATTVWPPTGIAIAALFLGGRRLWPAIFLAALVVNASTGVPLWACLVIACGNTLEAFTATELLRRWQFRRAMDRVQDVLQMGMVALLATTISASLGTMAIWLAHIPIKDGYTLFWLVWWTGDVLGALLIAPLIFTWTSDWRPSRRAGRWAEGALVLGLLLLTAGTVFNDLFRQHVVLLARGTYSVWPLLIWAALRFRQRGATAALLVLGVVAVVGTALGHGVYRAEPLHERLFRVQCYMAISTLSMLVLAAALAERRQAVRARDEFISIASHELKTPLTALRLRLGMADRLVQVAARSPEKAEKLAQVLQAAGTVTERMARLIDDLLDVSRLTANRLALDLEEVRLGDLLAEVVARLRDLASETGSAVRVDIDEPDAPMVGTWDRVRLEQVVTNLLTNAIKYGAGKEIVVSARARGERIEVAVRDGGIGISKADQTRIFHAFERVASSHRVGGLGLGLYIGRCIAEAHGGSLSVTSSPGDGSTFVLDLPSQTPRPDEARSTAVPSRDG
jgi:signal transduction histidine kinase